MIGTTRTNFSIADLLVLLCALIMLGAFLFMPWFDLPDDTTVTGYNFWKASLAEEKDLRIDFPVNRITNMFIFLVPVTALVGAGLALWGLLAERYERMLPFLTLVVGLVGIGYYFGIFFYENRENVEAGRPDATGFLGLGFYVALFAAAGFVLQFAIPRPGVSLKPVKTTPVALAEEEFIRFNWRKPFAWLLTQYHNHIGRHVGYWTRRVVSPLQLGRIPMLAYLIGLVAAAEVETRNGNEFARLLGFRKVPTLFGAKQLLEPFSDLKFDKILTPFFPAAGDKIDKPLDQSWTAIKELYEAFKLALHTQPGARDPGFYDVLKDVITYDLVIFVIPVVVVALLLRVFSNRALRVLPEWLAGALQVVVLYQAVIRWGELSAYRELVLIFMGVNIMLSVSLNLVNGYMGEFSVGHAGFMAVGAYVSSVITMWAFTETDVFAGAPNMNPNLGLSLGLGLGIPFGFLVALIAGGVAAAIAGLLVAFPSFRTRGDYLAIVTLAVNFIVTGVINNIEAVGGPRGLNGVPLWSTVKWVFILTIGSVWIVHSLVSSTFGKGIIAIREDEIAAELMGVNTRRVKLVAFMVSSFIAGMSGGLFAHVLAYVNPGMFGIMKSTEALVMVYLGGMGSISGSVIAAILFTILIEGLRPLAVLKWVVIPLILIILMLFRPKGLFGFRELKLNFGGEDEDEGEPESDPELALEVSDAATGD